MKSKTPEEKARDAALTDLGATRNRCLTAWSFKKLVTHRDLLRDALGLNNDGQSIFPPEQLDKPVSYKQILDFFMPYEAEIHASFEKAKKQAEEPIPEETVQTVHTEDEMRPCEEHEKLPPCKRQKAFLFPFQERAARQLLDNIIVRGYNGQMLRAAVGTGKTYIIAAVIARLIEMKFCEGKTFSPWAICYITRASVVEQTKRVLSEQFGICVLTEVQVINIEALRASFGELMVHCDTVIELGEAHLVWSWRKGVHPLFIFLDECQAVKNTDSQQSQILQAFNNIRDIPTYQVYFSATPFMRVAEAKCFAVSTRMRTKYGLAESVPLSNDTWHSFAKSVARPAEPEEYSPAAVERLMTKLSPYIVDVKGVRSQFKAINGVQMIQFQNKSEADFYHQAWERYEAMIEKIRGYSLSDSQSRFLILAQFTVFRRAAELCRAPYLAKCAWEIVQTGKQVPVIAVSFKGTIRRMVDIWVNDYNVSRDDISLIWGGGKTAQTKKQKVKGAIVNNEILQQALKDIGITLTDLNLADVQDYIEEEDDPALRLGNQSLKERQREIDRFQRGRSHYCAFTLKAGGVGLSLHHTDEFTKEKCRRKKNGWVYVEDIPLIPTLQRVCLLTPSFSAIELVQGLGRCPRLTSLSDTPQTMVFYSGTIEERVAQIVSLKLRCLRKVVRSRESWEDCIVGGIPEQECRELTVVKNQPAEEEPEEADGFFGGDDEEEE